jgi:glycosyltransferase involved in cell wall biosynthesis
VGRILILIKGLGRGGAEQLIVSAALHYDRAIFDYEIAYVLPWKDALVPELERLGVRATCLGDDRGRGWLRRLRAFVRESGIDLVHAHLPYVAIGARVALPDTPIVYTEHNEWARYHKATFWANAITYPRNSYVFAVSEEVRRSIRYPRPLRHRRMPPVETLYHGIDHRSIGSGVGADGVRKEFGISDRVPLIGTVANFKPHKGQEHLLRAARIVRERLPDACFLLVGLGPREEQMRQQAEQLGLDGSVVFAGFREDARRIMAALDLFVLPSEHEGLPIALLEAMALGRPAVVTAVGGVPEVVTDGREGYIVPPRDPEALAERIVELIEDPAKRAEMGERALERAADFDIRKAVRRMEEVYKELLS